MEALWRVILEFIYLVYIRVLVLNFGEDALGDTVVLRLAEILETQ